MEEPYYVPAIFSGLGTIAFIAIGIFSDGIGDFNKLSFLVIGAIMGITTALYVHLEGKRAKGEK